MWQMSVERTEYYLHSEKGKRAVNTRLDWQHWCESISGATTVTGVVAWPVRHSLSPSMHNAAFAALGLNWAYVPFPVPPEQLGTAVAAFSAMGIRGVNVTIPHKSAVAGFLDALDPAAEILGAVNTIDVCEGRLTGYNTDGPGFVASMHEVGWSAVGRAVAIIGAGGSSRAVAHALLMAGASRLAVVNRTPEKAEAMVQMLTEIAVPEHGSVDIVGSGLDAPSARDLVTEADIIVDCASVVMYPQVDVPPVVSPEWLHDGQLVADLTYNPRLTVLLQAAQTRGCATLEGTGMLVHQGAIAFEIWTGRKAPVETMRKALLAQLR